MGISGTAHSSERLAKELAVGGMGLRKNRSSSILEREEEREGEREREREREGSRERERGRERSIRVIMHVVMDDTLMK